MDAVLDVGSRQHRVEGSTVSLTLLPVFPLMQPRILLTFWGSKYALLSRLDGVVVKCGIRKRWKGEQFSIKF